MKKPYPAIRLFFLGHRRNEPATVRNNMFRFGKIGSDLKRFFYDEPRDKSRDGR